MGAAARSGPAGERDRSPRWRIAATRMSVSPQPAPGETDISRGWHAALEALAADWQRRAVAARTRRAYASDASEFARWASTRELEPRSVDVRALRRYVAGLAEQGRAPSTVARKL